MLAQAGSSWFAMVQAIVQNVPAVAPPPPPPPPPPCVLQMPLLHSVLVFVAIVHFSPVAIVPPPASPEDPASPDELAPELLLDELELLDDDEEDFPDDDPPLEEEVEPELLPPPVVSSPLHAAENPARQIRPAENAIRPQVASFIRRNLHLKT